MDGKYRAIVCEDRLSRGKFAVTYITADCSLTIAGLHQASANELARLMNSSCDIYINGIFSREERAE